MDHPYSPDLPPVPGTTDLVRVRDVADPVPVHVHVGNRWRAGVLTRWRRTRTGWDGYVTWVDGGAYYVRWIHQGRIVPAGR